MCVPMKASMIYTLLACACRASAVMITIIMQMKKLYNDDDGDGDGELPEETVGGSGRTGPEADMEGAGTSTAGV